MLAGKTTAKESSMTESQEELLATHLEQLNIDVREEKLGDRITALHQLVSPFGKNDTPAVLLEAIGYIRFLVGQVEALSSPYMSNAARNTAAAHQQQHSADSQGRSGMKDLRSKGLCLVPISCTQHVGNGNGNGAD